MNTPLPLSPLVDLSGKTGLITGIANDKSIAYGVAQACRRAGADLVVTYQTEKTLKFVEPLAESLGAELIQCDVTQPGSLEGVFASLAERGLDFLVHSMAFAPKDDLHGRVIDCSLEGFQQAMDISVHSFLRMAKLAEPVMKPGGAMVTMTYLGADRVVPHYGVMGLAKAALESATRYMAHELGEKDVRVFAVSPGPMLTRAASGIAQFNNLLESAQTRSPLHRLASIDNVGALTAFLVSDAASGMTGSTIYVDAGYHIEA